METIIVKSEHGMILAHITDRAGMIDVLKAVIKDLATDESNEHTMKGKSLYTQKDILVKLKAVLALHNAKDAGDTKHVDMKELQQAADGCDDIDCHHCALDNIVESYQCHI